MEQTKGDLIWSGLKNVTILYVRNVDDEVTNIEPVILVWALSSNLSEWILQNWEQRKLIVPVFSITSLRKRLHEMKVRIMGMSYLSIRPLSVRPLSVRPYTSNRILLEVFLLHFTLVVQKYVKQLGAVRANGIPTSFRFVQVRRNFSSETILVKNILLALHSYNISIWLRHNFNSKHSSTWRILDEYVERTAPYCITDQKDIFYEKHTRNMNALCRQNGGD